MFPQIFLVMGPPGTGKTTQAQTLAQNLGSPHLNTGDLLYYAAQGNDPAAQDIKKAMEKGEMVDEKITEQLVEKYLYEHENSEHIVVDGFPRTLEQAQMIKFPITKIFYLKVGDVTVKERLSKRERHDDTPELIEKRLKVYHEETEPILDFYRQKGILEEIDGDRTVEEVARDIEKKASSS
ncbi:MAG: hypothetical protein A2700_02675 [Candidatus Blackburnbacteria bacterium RIFCSPHIGHO2_01_FULL_44_64]|uniref:Adenylate kinase n=1 Tax=Candidatus Blackburnbacteria bacterium RIFCSPHIGHO2_02_FULL_44_20 TaxID=1797516 RepID=A0A1G1VA67_9BACT|nr:MAG: hypothetical protein A2700_02675 [Candidatus Blackburnbacteria bacterium RIFCSPHIGHO2_01_FULL_44_64]OGY11842.1 MAG: hypothetical protein A3E16_00730 [Candidatus Blackburnbacteria bacterium RIFCSPHIGHO2_12_FULL_44_25]OGY12374.1 MAG: hypothetical protein A3D26_01955 [Candidatus Blackburnbacteria bacterium RIFCSPHIGHO2_02_FULL_44_20]OGY15079.1 MAG: hypothetical protein A3A62_03355 [Candidatus Blackburnbacteria bacterium RIFCSPLOWO2_01_FULL_44_43]OGY16023.1 MAG: hypothetical protein A3H88_0